MGQWGIPKLDLNTSFLVSAGSLSLNFSDNSRRAVVPADTQQLALLVEFTKDVNNLELLIEYQNEQLDGTDQFFQRVAIDSSGLVKPDILSFNASGKYHLPFPVLRTTKYVKVSVRNAIAPDNGSVNVFFIDEA